MAITMLFTFYVHCSTSAYAAAMYVNALIFLYECYMHRITKEILSRYYTV